MRPGRIAIALVVLLGLLCGPVPTAQACATCNIDGGSGQLLMLIFMLSVPLVALAVGISVVRRLLRRLEASS